MHTLVVLVNYRTARLTIDALRSLEPEVRRCCKALGPVSVVVCDNASGDGSAEEIEGAITEAAWGDWCSLRRLDRNGGFAFGNNAAIREALAGPAPPRFVYLLNTDTLALDGCISELVAFLEAHPEAGIAGGRAENPDGTVRRSAFRFHSVLGEVESTLKMGPATRLLERWKVAPEVPTAPQRVDWVSGASMMIRREVFDAIGLLDEGYFLYFEETDFCLRAAGAGFECWYVPHSRIIHLVGQSSGVTGQQQVLRRRPKYWFESRRRFFLTHHGRARLLAADALFILAQPVSRLWQILRRRPRSDPPMLWWDFLRYNYLSRQGTAARQGK